MVKKLDLITPGNVLQAEFMDPLGVSQNRLARDIDVPPSRIHGIVHGKRPITADMAMRLAKYFQTSAEMWLNLQSHFELEALKKGEWPELEKRIRTRPGADTTSDVAPSNG